MNIVDDGKYQPHTSAGAPSGAQIGASAEAIRKMSPVDSLESAVERAKEMMTELSIVATRLVGPEQASEAEAPKIPSDDCEFDRVNRAARELSTRVGQAYSDLARIQRALSGE